MSRGRTLLAVTSAGIAATVLLLGGAPETDAHADPLAVVRANARSPSPAAATGASLSCLDPPGRAGSARARRSRGPAGRPAADAGAETPALERGETAPDDGAWTLTQTGNVRFTTGRLDAAATQYRQALLRFPG